MYYYELIHCAHRREDPILTWPFLNRRKHDI